MDAIWKRILKTGGFYLLVVLIIVFAVFPFYYAIVTSFKTGTELFDPSLFPLSFSFGNYVSVFQEQPFRRNLLNSIAVSLAVVVLSLFLGVTAAYALARVRFRGRTLLLLTILAVSMFPQIAVLVGPVRADPLRWASTTRRWALIFSYMIFTLPFTVWVLTTFMRDLPIEIEEAAIVDGATPWVIITKVFLPLMWPALVTTGPARLHRRLERVPVRADLHVVERHAHRAGGHRAAVGRHRSSRFPGATSWRPRSS